jgi:hypothetical protein
MKSMAMLIHGRPKAAVYACLYGHYTAASCQLMHYFEARHELIFGISLYLEDILES